MVVISSFIIPVPSINSSPLNNLRLLDTGKLDEFFDHTGGIESINGTAGRHLGHDPAAGKVHYHISGHLTFI
jgi:hypothetical protein